MSGLFEQMVASYAPKTREEERNAIYEVMQKVTLAGLWRGGFFDKAAFYGGTCLRIFHQLPRFSEDMDFSLLKKDESFNIEDYFDAVMNEFQTIGRNVEITKKDKHSAQNEQQLSEYINNIHPNNFLIIFRILKVIL